MDEVTSIEGLLKKYTFLVTQRSHHVSSEGLLADIARVAKQLPDCHFFVRQKKFFPDGVGEFVVLFHYSFQVVGGCLEKFGTLAACLQTYNSVVNDARYNEPNLLVTSIDPNYMTNAGSICKVASVVTSVYHAFVYDNILRASARRLQKNLLQIKTHYSLDDLLDHLSNSYKPAGLSYFECKLDIQIAKLNVRDYGRCEALFLDQIDSDIRIALTRSQQTDGLLKDKDRLVHFVLIPASQHNWKVLNGDGTAKFILIFAEDHEVEEFLIRFVEEGIKGSADYDKSRKQLLALQLVNRAKQKLLDGIRLGTIGLPIARRATVARELQELTRSVFDCTSAHSVSIRRFNPFNDTLEVLAQTAFDSGRYRSDFSGEIPTSLENSINVKCFETCAPGEHIYLPKMELQQETDTISGGTFNPRGSKSEICFPIWKSGVPVGTLNVESPINFAFSHDIAFLDSVARAVSDLVSTEYDAIPPAAVAQLAQVNELAHATLGGASGGIDQQELDRLPPITRSTVREWMKFETSFRKPISKLDNGTTDLRKLVIQTIRDSLTAEQFKRTDINKLVVVPEIMISKYEAAYVKSILLAVTANAVKHSKLGQDYFRVILISRASRRILVIRYKSEFAEVQNDVAARFGAMPVQNEEGMRYGAFLLGSRVRAAGGLLEVKRPSQSNAVSSLPLELAIALPLGDE